MMILSGRPLAALRRRACAMIFARENAARVARNIRAATFAVVAANMRDDEERTALWQAIHIHGHDPELASRAILARGGNAHG